MTTTIFNTQIEYAKHRGISQGRVSQMIKQGKIPHGCLKTISGRKLIDQKKADEHLRKTRDSFFDNRSSKPSVEEMQEVVKKTDLTLDEARLLKVHFEGKLKELEYEKEKGSLVSAEQVEDDFFNIARRTRDAILNIPGRISAELAGCNDQHRVNQILTSEIIQALEELSRE